jgi:hypothetical protein
MVYLTPLAMHDHFRCDDLDGGVFNALLIFPATGLETALDINLLALGQVLFADFGQVTPGNHVEPFGIRMTFTVGGVPGAAGGDREGGHRAAGGRVAHFGFMPKIADNHDFVQSMTHLFLLAQKRDTAGEVI